MRARSREASPMRFNPDRAHAESRASAEALSAGERLPKVDIDEE